MEKKDLWTPKTFFLTHKKPHDIPESFFCDIFLWRFFGRFLGMIYIYIYIGRPFRNTYLYMFIIVSLQLRGRWLSVETSKCHLGVYPKRASGVPWSLVVPPKVWRFGADAAKMLYLSSYCIYIYISIVYKFERPIKIYIYIYSKYIGLFTVDIL